MSTAITARPRLSKSRFVAGVQCLKRLYWQVYEPEGSDGMDPAARARMEQGAAVGVEARRAFPGGVLVTADHEHALEALAQTAELIKDRNVPAIFEAALEHNDVLVRVDVLERLPRNRWRLVEVKSSTEVKEHYLYDVAIQRYVATGAGLRVSAACLMHLNRKYVYDGKQYDPQRLFLMEDLKPRIRKMDADITKLLAKERRILRVATPPKVEAGPHCDNPVPCEFYDRCHPEVAAGHISELPRLSPKKLKALQSQAISTIAEIPDSFPLTQFQRRIWNCIQSREPWFGPGLKKAFSTLRFPLRFMDFETFYPALPRHKGMRPYGHIPFQWSLHTLETPGGTLRHREFLAEDDSDPRPVFLTALLEELGDEGSIIVYNQQFEAERLKDLAGWLPEFSRPIAGVQKRLWDLLPVVRESVYHPNFAGSFSIKNVLPALVPEMTYEGMDVSNGSAAGLTWDALVNGRMGGAERDKLRDALRAYCRQDTLALVKLWETLRLQML